MFIGYLQERISGREGRMADFRLRNKKPKRKLATLLLQKTNHHKVTEEKPISQVFLCDSVVKQFGWNYLFRSSPAITPSLMKMTR